MEENFTRQKVDTLGITVYAEENSKPTAALLNDEPFAQQKNNRRLHFKAKDIALVNNPKQSDLAIVIAPEENKTANELAEKLLNNQNLRLRIVTGYDNVFEKVSEIARELEKALELGLEITDFMQIYRRGITMEKVAHQLTIFTNGIAKINLDRPAVIGDGITLLQKEEAAALADFFDSKKDEYKLKKFVPASGAATRMFKFLHDFINDYNPAKETINGYTNRIKDNALPVFLLGRERFPF